MLGFVGVNTCILLCHHISHITTHISAVVGLVFNACTAFNICSFQLGDKFHCSYVY